ncbi:MAG TPA: SDR family oxidoreductase [Bacteroidia bacterium]|nr:SDR family oxidoreductase [Bacteroidia bacterium]
MKTLENRTAVITGAASGMGKAMAELFASEGANVIAADRDEKDLAEVVKMIREKKGNVTAVVCDVTKESDVKNMIDKAVETYGGLDILVNNAGVLDDFMPVAEVSDDVWKRVMDVNLNGPFYACRLAVPVMLKKGKGSIINVASVGGLFGARAGVAYTTSKHAVIGLTKNVGYMYGDKGIRCNAIAPGGVNTNIGKGMNPNPLGYAKLSLGMGTNIRMGEPSEIAELALFLASDKSSLVNGTVITADAGWTAY